MHLCGIPADRRDGDGVLEQPARVVVVNVRARGQLAQPLPERGVTQEPSDDRPQPGMAELAPEELEEAVELVGVAPQAWSERRDILVGRLE